MTFSLIKNFFEHPALMPPQSGWGNAKDYNQILFNWAGINYDAILKYACAEHCLNLLHNTPAFKKPQTSYLISVAENPQQQTFNIEWGCCATPFGDALLANSAKGLIAIDFLDTDEQIKDALEHLQQQWPSAKIFCNQSTVSRLCRELFNPPNSQNLKRSIYVYVCANAFQVRVWQTLANIPAGRLVSYGQLATLCGQPGAARAVGTALASNQVAWVIPCHRVIQADGSFGHYRWQTARKKAMHVWEIGHLSNQKNKLAVQ